eukprot:Sspe_Gene.93006::Locus_65729_Transcript_1_1_Confidence_1.000_Length_608::g.93006::m.93006
MPMLPCLLVVLLLVRGSAAVCTPSKCIDPETLAPADTAAAQPYRECIKNANGVKAFVCSCTSKVWECLCNKTGGNCSTGRGPAEIDEATPWCLNYVSRQGLQCSPQLCGPPLERFRLPEAWVQILVITVFIVSALHLILHGHFSSSTRRRPPRHPRHHRLLTPVRTGTKR